MQTVTIPKNEYQSIIRRQFQIEKELTVLKKAIIRNDENRVNPSILKKWDKISHNLDQRKGRHFSSIEEMKKWLRDL